MNFRRILSKSSLRSSSSAGKSLAQAEEVSKLQSEIELLNQTIDSLKISVESRDAAIGTIAREKEKLYVELKSAQRTNRNLHQQLVDERDIHSKEKEFLINEIKRNSQDSDHMLNASLNMQLKEDRFMWSLNELKSKDEVIYNIGAKYLKIKSSKTSMLKKFNKLKVENQKTCDGILTLLTENRRNLDTILENLIECSTLPPNNKNYKKLLQMNANLQYENTQLKITFLAQKEHVENIEKHSNINSCYSNMQSSQNKLGDKNKFVCDGKMRHHITCSKLCKGHRRLKHFKCDSPCHGEIVRSHSDSCLLISKLK